jgi:hypothetical protein
MKIDDILIELLRQRTHWQRQAQQQIGVGDNAQSALDASTRIAVAIQTLEPLTHLPKA